MSDHDILHPLYDKLMAFLETELPPYRQTQSLTPVFEKALVAFAIRRARGNAIVAARIIGCTRVTVRKRLDRIALDLYGRDASSQPPRTRRNGSIARHIHAP